MASSVGATLKSLCLKPKELFGSAAGQESPARLVAEHLNREIIDHNTTGSRGVDGMVMVTDLSARRLYVSEGKFDIYLFERGFRDKADIRKIGNMYPGDGSTPLSESFGQDPGQRFSEKNLPLQATTVVVAFSDGAGNVFEDAGYGERRADFRTLIAETVANLGERPKNTVDLVEALAKALVEKLDQCRAPAQPDIGAPLNERDDDELVFVFSPLNRPWKGQQK
nr:SpoIIE family protein phosphatase [Salipiger pentaromativorans]